MEVDRITEISNADYSPNKMGKICLSHFFHSLFCVVTPFLLSVATRWLLQWALIILLNILFEMLSKCFGERHLIPYLPCKCETRTHWLNLNLIWNVYCLTFLPIVVSFPCSLARIAYALQTHCHSSDWRLCDRRIQFICLKLKLILMQLFGWPDLPA